MAGIFGCPKMGPVGTFTFTACMQCSHWFYYLPARLNGKHKLCFILTERFTLRFNSGKYRLATWTLHKCSWSYFKSIAHVLILIHTIFAYNFEVFSGTHIDGVGWTMAICTYLQMHKNVIDQCDTRVVIVRFDLAGVNVPFDDEWSIQKKWFKSSHRSNQYNLALSLCYRSSYGRKKWSATKNTARICSFVFMHVSWEKIVEIFNDSAVNYNIYPNNDGNSSIRLFTFSLSLLLLRAAQFHSIFVFSWKSSLRSAQCIHNLKNKHKNLYAEPVNLVAECLFTTPTHRYENYKFMYRETKRNLPFR